MTNFNFIATANESIKNVSKQLRNGNKEFNSLSSVLKDIQRKQYMKAGYADVFKSLGLPTDGRFTPADFFKKMNDEQFKTVTVGRGKNKKEEKRLGIWGWAQKKDEDGTKIFEEDGVTPVMVPVLRVVSSWTSNKLFACIAQANALAK